ncbi:hypothetical protein ACOMHN_039848 [Nucella lapillus]
MIRRTLSRALVGLCIVYLLLVVVFHRQLVVPSINESVSDDYSDAYGDDNVRENRHIPYDVGNQRVTRSVNLSQGFPDSVLKAKGSKRLSELSPHLQRLEQGMTQLEQQIADVKSKLTIENGPPRDDTDRRKPLGMVFMDRDDRVAGRQGPPMRREGTKMRVAKPDPMAEKREESMYKNSSLLRIGQGVALYSAYHDDRSTFRSYVRLMTIMEKAKGKDTLLLCHFHSPSHALSKITEARAYEMCENHAMRFRGYIFSCPVPQALERAPTMPYNLSVSLPDDGHSHSPVPVPVQPVTPPSLLKEQGSENVYHQFKYTYSLCVSPLFGKVSGRRLVEFLELTRLLGVQQVFLYDFSVSAVIRRLLRFYQEKGWVTVLPWRLPTPFTEKKIWYHGQLITNNDCLYRTMALSAYTAFHDIDEVIVPRGKGLRTWADIIPVVLPNDTCGFSFHSSFFNPNPPEASADDDLMTVSRFFRTIKLSKVRTKVLVAPRRVFEVGIHHISKQYQEHWLPRPYDASRAILHHYRRCLADFGMDCRRLVNDTVIRDNFMPQLRDNFSRTVKALGL